MSSTLTLSPLLPWSVLAVLGLIALALVGVTALRRARGWLLRAGVLAVLFAALLGPDVVRRDLETLPDVAVIIVDRSPSQGVGQRPQQTDTALADLEQAAGRLEGMETRVVSVDADDPDAGTALFAAADRALAEVPAERRAGVVMITDGQIHDAPAPDDAADLGAPLHVLLTGDDTERDRRLVVDRAPAYGLVGEPLTIIYRVDDLRGDDRTVERAPVTVHFRMDGADAGSASVTPGQPRTFQFTLTHAGPTALEIEAETAPDELSPLNNRAVLTVNGIRERLRALLVSGLPHQGERMWRNLLKSDPGVDLVHFTILRPPQKTDSATIRELSLIAFPVEELFEEKLYDFDLIVFDRYVLRGVLPWRYLGRIADYVENGGALLLSVGPEFASPANLSRTPLGHILPAVPTGRVFETAFRPTTTNVGHRHPVTSALPGETAMGDAEAGDPGQRWGHWFRAVETEVSAGDVLMTGPDGLPLLVVNRVGRGRVAQLTSDHLWLWARGFEGGGPYGELTRRLAHWLMQEPELEEERLTATVDNGRLLIERRSLSADPLMVTVTEPDGDTERLTLTPDSDGVARTERPASQRGLYQVTDGARTALAASGPLNPKEFTDLRATDTIVAPVVEATGGGVFRLAHGMPTVRSVRPGHAAAGAGWLGLRRNGAAMVTGVDRVPLLPALLVLAASLAGLAAAWWREGR